ncbi:S-layer homology domain-containing protein [Paenalkalicoccus suaedae]|uniref:S-layer homology domain-containing protein n=1 Tax=Paenalkalicoccus suaedae TaxID=2592382 RepID=A0A859FD24_9BACI|nr:S-layer homology domain-containing protein [Paenalkalicoccus suaedae]QKS70474.1 S-layer homology domain-containing protein [Paenalkalicoccus suaedae]
MNGWKRQGKKIVTVLVVLAVVITSMNTAYANGSVYANNVSIQAVQFSDINGHFAEKQIEDWNKKGLIIGFPNGTFQPNQAITRAEFMSLANRAFNYTTKADISYQDVSKNMWFYDTVAVASAAGYMQGYTDNTIKPQQAITRQEAAKVIAVIKNLPEKEQSASSFQDSSSIPTWSKGFIGAVAASNMMNGYPDGSFKPQRNMTRAEAVITFSNALDIDASKPSKPTGTTYNLNVDAPAVEAPLPVVQNGGNAGDSILKNIAATNPFIKILDGFEQVWSLNQPEWRDATALTVPGANGEVANYGDGPTVYFDGYKNDKNAVVADKKTYASEEIRNKATWEANIKYVEEVTQNRTDEEALAAYYDDQRDKIYSMIDGFGPLANTYVDIVEPTTSVVRSVDEMNNVLEEATVEDQSQGIGSNWDEKELADMVGLVDLFRFRIPASSNPAKYFFSSPRPYRMNSNGEVVEVVDENGLAVWETIGSGESSREPLASGGSKQSGERHFQQYETNVEVIPALKYVGRIAEDGRGKDGAFPSGHTSASYLSAFGFAMATPERYAEFLTRAAQMGENRVVTGMHSPLDIVGGRIQSTAMIAYALNQDENKEKFEKAYENAGEVFGALAEENGMSLYDFAHTVTEDYMFESAYDETKWEDHDENKAFYREKLTYGLPQTGEKGLDPEVPEGAEVLLETRQPYLNDEQRREVLYTTSIDSGYPVIDESNGWGRIDLVTAADGYGALLSNVTVDMDASKGRFNSQDWWRNNISGSGMLTKKGTGTLTLTGDNTYEGGTVLQAGVLEATSKTAFGKGDFYLENGTVLVNTYGALRIAGNFTMEDGDVSLKVNNGSSQMNVDETVYIDGGDLTLDLSEVDIKDSATMTLMTAGTVIGQFDNVMAEGFEVSLSYEKDRITARVTAK